MNLNHKWVGYRNDGPFLLLLHEALGSIGQWKDFPERLSEVLNLPVLVYERQGHGMSPDFNQERTDHYLEQYAFEELPAFLELLQLQERKCLLYGHSDGGSIALLYASKYPSNVIGVISEAAHIFVEDITLDGIDAAVAYNNKYNLIDKLEKYHPEKAEKLFYAWADTWRRPSYYNWNIEPLLSIANHPSLIIQGEDDQYGSMLQVDRICEKLGKNAISLKLPLIGHAPWKEDTTNILHIVNEFYKDKISQ